MAAGAVARIEPGDQITADAQLQWTFPLNFCEIVWGDGRKAYREIVPAHDTSQFGQKRFQITLKAPGAKWARFAVWDIAADGALTQPVRFDNAP